MSTKDENLNFYVSRKGTSNATKTSESLERVSFCNVQGRLKKWKEENTCTRCGITYENFQTLANHSCHPFRCNVCSEAFLFDYMLKMHKCGEIQSDIKEIHKTPYYCDTSRSSFINPNLLLQHRSVGSKERKKLCEGCQRILPTVYKHEFCFKCRQTRNKTYYLRQKFHTNESNHASPEIPLNNGIENSVEFSSISTDRDCTSYDLNHSTRKRKSVDGISGKISTKSFVMKNSVITDLSNFNSEDSVKSPLQADRKCSRYSCDSADKKSESSNLTRKRRSVDADISANGSGRANSKSVKDENVVKTNSKNSIKESPNFTRKKKLPDSAVLVNCFNKNCSMIIGDETLGKTVSVTSDLSSCKSSNSSFCRNFPVNTRKKKSIDYSVLDKGHRKISSKGMDKDMKYKNDIPVSSLNCKHDTKRRFIKRGKNNLVHFKRFINNNSTKKIPVRDVLTAKQDVDSTILLKHSVVSILSQNVERNSLDKKKIKSKLHSAINYNNNNEIKNDNKTDIFQNSHKVVSCSIYSKNDVKSKRERWFTKKSKLEAVPTKSTKLMENISSTTEKIKTESASAKVKILPVKSKRESCVGRKTESCSVPELEVSESTLNSAPERTRSPARTFTAKDRESDKGYNSKKSDISNSDTDVVKLEFVLNALPDEDSGVLLRISSKNSDNFRCPKCNKLFKRVKMASIHYINCKSFKVKKKMSVSFNHIEWICLHCHFHCKYLPDLTLHKRSCRKSSSSVSIENCIRNYSETCRYSCSNCNYSCLSAISLNLHSCEKEFQRMKKCFIGVTKLSKCDLYDANLSKYECEFCESLFFNFASYKKHHDKHKSNEILTTRKFFIVNGKAYAKQEIKNIIKRNQNFQTSDDIVKSWLEPICNIVTDTDLESDSLFPGLNLDVMIPYELEKLLPAVAEKILAEKDEESALDKAIANSYFTSQSEPSTSCAANDLQTSNSGTGSSSDDLKTYLKDFSCKCFGVKTADSIEKKPCLKCLNDYIRRKSCHSISGDKQNSASPTQNVQETSKIVSSSSLVSDNAESTTCNANTFLVPPVSEEVLPIEISSVSSYYEAASGNPSLDVSGCGDNFLDVSDATVISSMSNVQSMYRSVSSDIFPSNSPVTLESLAIVVIAVVKADFIKSMYSIDAHLKLINSILNLKTSSSSGSKEDVSSKTLLSEEAENGDSLSSNILQHLDFGLSTTCSTENPCESDVIDGENCLGLENDINSSSNLLSDNIQQHIDSVLQSTDDDGVPFSLESEILACENCPVSVDFMENLENMSKWNIKTYCPFDKFMAVLVELEPCDFDVVAYCSLFEIHVTWQVAPDIKYSAFISPKSDTFICGWCYDSVRSHTFLEHFISKHEQRVLNVIIADNL